MLWVFVLSVAAIVFAPRHENSVVEKPVAFRPPATKRILAAIPPPATGMARVVDKIEREELLPGYWKCEVFYSEEIHLGWFVVPLGRHFYQQVYIDQRADKR